MGTKVKLCTRYLAAFQNMNVEGSLCAGTIITPVLVSTAMDISASTLAGVSPDQSTLL
jgi:hypothetical protein